MSRVRTRTGSASAWTTGTAAVAASAALGALLGACSSSGTTPASAPTPHSSVLASPGGFAGDALNPANAGGGPGYHDTRITLPETVDLSFQRPERTTDRTEHQVLFTVQEALRAQLYAEYGTGGTGGTSTKSGASSAGSTGANPLLTTYWSGPALAAAQAEITAFLKKGQQPQGLLVVTGTTYTAPDSSGATKVTYCANWAPGAPGALSKDGREGKVGKNDGRTGNGRTAKGTKGTKGGTASAAPSAAASADTVTSVTATATAVTDANADADADTNAVIPATASPIAQPVTTQGTYTTLTLVRTGGRHWQVRTLTAAADSAQCSNSD